MRRLANWPKPLESVSTSLFLRCRKASDIDLWPREVDSPAGREFVGFGHHASHVQQRLGGNAAAEQTRAAESRLRLDQRYLHTSVGGEKRGGITTGTATEDNKLRMHGVWRSNSSATF